MTSLPALVYVFWHWPRASIQRSGYEADQRAFHEAFRADPPSGFVCSSTAAVAGAPWANGGSTAYQDSYFLRDAAALDALEGAVARGRRQEAHTGAARGAAAGTAGLYRIRCGTPPSAPRHSIWFSKPDGMTYDQLFGLVTPLIGEGESTLWMRRMVLGPTPEFCLQSRSPTRRLPAPLSPLDVPLQPVWPQE